jgi:hypothetical protein
MICCRLLLQKNGVAMEHAKKKGAAALGKCRHVHGTLEPIKHKH